MRIAVVIFDYRNQNLRLLPWRYVHEITKNFKEMGQEVIIVTDGSGKILGKDSTDGIPVIHLRHVKPFPPLDFKKITKVMAELNPDVVLWVMGITSFLQKNLYQKLGYPIVALIGSPLYSLNELFRNLNVFEIIRNARFIFTNFAEALVPRKLVRNTFNLNALKSVVTMSRRNRERLEQIGVNPSKIVCMPPGIDVSFLEIPSIEEVRKAKRTIFEDSGNYFLVTYLGPPLFIRGIDTLLFAVKLATRKHSLFSSLRVLILSREQGQAYRFQQRRLMNLVVHLGLSKITKIVNGFLDKELVKRLLAASDLVVLPFKHVISDTPISVLESMSLGIPVLSTDIDGIPELLENGRGLIINPGDFKHLAALITYYQEDKDKLKAYGRKGREYALIQPSWKETASKILVLLNRSRSSTIQKTDRISS